MGDYAYYSAVSDEIFNFLRQRYPLLETASIDECYIDMSHLKIEHPQKYFQDLQKEIYEKMHIPCSIGVSYNKFLAKMASDYRKPMGITFIKKRMFLKLFGLCLLKICMALEKLVQEN